MSSKTEVMPFLNLEQLEKILIELEEIHNIDNEAKFKAHIKKLSKTMDLVKIHQVVNTAHEALMLLIPLIKFRTMIEKNTENKMVAEEFDRDLAVFVKIVGIDKLEVIEEVSPSKYKEISKQKGGLH